MRFVWGVCLLLLLPSSLLAGNSKPTEAIISEAVSSYKIDGQYKVLSVDFPLDGTLFPPDLAPPLFAWRDEQAETDCWVIVIGFDDGQTLRFLSKEPLWVPDTRTWETIAVRSVETPANVTILGVRTGPAAEVVSVGRVSFVTSRDEVGAPLFYREVNLPFIEAVKDPSKIRWRFGPVSSVAPPPIVLDGLPVCGNCHSFSANGDTLGMDVDYANDKGSYAIVNVESQMLLGAQNIITWSDYRRDDGQLTFGLLSQVSPDGRHVVSTVKDRSVFVPRDKLAFSQLFFPIKGILAVYSRADRKFASLPGADDPSFVQSNPSWSPDGKTIVFARSKAYRLRNDRGEVLLTKEECKEFLEEGKTFLFDLCTVPFNGGRGGEARPLPGASGNGVSNYFARYSPDGKWIVFCKATSFMLLQPDSELWIIPATGGQARRLACNTERMNSWHSWSPNGKWLVFSAKPDSPYTKLFLTHIDEQGNSSPAIWLHNMTADDRAANIPEFVNADDKAITAIDQRFVDDTHYVRAGDAYMETDGDVDGALAAYRKAVGLNPANAIAHSNLGGLLVNRGELESGVAHLLESIRLDPGNASPHYNLGMFRFRQQRTDEAVEHLSTAVRLDPSLCTAHRVLGAISCSQGQFDGGIRSLSQAVACDPSDAVAHYLLAKAMMSNRGRDFGPVVDHLSRAVELDPEYVEARCDLGMVLFGQGRFGEAKEQLTRAHEVQPENLRLLRDLAFLLAASPNSSVRDGTKAVELAKRACDLTEHRSPGMLDVLSMAQAEQGRFEEAIQTANRALAICRSAGAVTMVSQIESRIELYRQQKAYRLPTKPAPESSR